MGGNACSGGMCAVGRAKGVIYKCIRELRKGRRKFRIVLFLACVETHVLKEGDVTVAQLGDLGFNLRTNAILDKGNGLPELSGEILGDRRKAEVGILLSLGSAEVAAKDNFGALFDEVANRGKGRNDSGIVGNRSVLQGNIKVAAHEHALPGEVDVFDGLSGHDYFE